MSFNAAIPGLGCTVSYCTTEGGSYTPVGQLKGIGGTNSEVGMWDSSGLASAAGEQIPTLFRAGDFSFNVVFNTEDTTQVSGATSLHAYHKAKTLLYWKLTWPAAIGPGVTGDAGTTYAFAAYVKSFGTSGYEVEGGIEAAIGLAITGEVTITDPA